MSLTIRRRNLRLFCFIVEILGKEGLRNSGFDIPRGKITARQAVMLNRVEEELPSITDIAKADDIELQEIMENAARSTGNLIEQLEANLPTICQCVNSWVWTNSSEALLGFNQGGGGKKGSVERKNQERKA